MMRAADNAAIRSAIGVGQTDAPTFLAQTLTGQILTGTQATSLVDLATTWNTLGTPTALKLNVANTLSNAASNLMDLQVGGVSKFTVNKSGELSMNSLDPATKIAYANAGFQFFGSGGVGFYLGQDGSGNGNAVMSSTGYIGFSSVATPSSSNSDIRLARDAAGILAQRNGVLKQVFRVYNTNLGGAPEWGGFDWQTTTNTLRIGTDKSGTGASQPIDFVTGGVVRMALNATDATFSVTLRAAALSTYAGTGWILGLDAAYNTGIRFQSFTDSVLVVRNAAATDLNRICLGGTTDAFPAIARDGAGIKFTGAAAGSTSWIKVPAVAVASLPAAATAGVGARSFVNDALTPVFGSAVTGGGAVTVPVYSTGSAWNVG
jgi:hypothetical protein